MRVFVAGAAGVIGQRLVPLLTAAGHEVTGTTRSAARETEIRRLGATPVIVLAAPLIMVGLSGLHALLPR